MGNLISYIVTLVIVIIITFVYMAVKDKKENQKKALYSNAYDVVKTLYDFYVRLKFDTSIMKCIEQSIQSTGTGVETLRLLLFGDLIKCYEQLGYNATYLNNVEGLPLVLATFKIYSNEMVAIGKTADCLNACNNVNKSIKKALQNNSNNKDFFYLNEIFKMANANDLKIQYFSLLYRFFSVVAKADGQISIAESDYLEKLMTYSTSTEPSRVPTNNKTIIDNSLLNQSKPVIETAKKIIKPKVEKPKQKEISEPNNNGYLDTLNNLIGLNEVKNEVTALVNFLKIQREREKRGMKSVGLSYHCVFTGNPGTGKTTVARILANIYKSLGILETGHLVETDRSGLVAEYVGQTAIKTNNIIDSALGGVLFIDEAYSLVQGSGNDYGREAISTLLKRMEDDRDNLVVILAGYSDDMKSFIDSNPGLQSRFNRYIHFSDYNAAELKQIFLQNVEKNQYKLDFNGAKKLDEILTYAVEHKDKNFGNGRFVRNLFEKTIQNQAMRLSRSPRITADELSTITENDLPCQ